MHGSVCGSAQAARLSWGFVTASAPKRCLGLSTHTVCGWGLSPGSCTAVLAVC